MRINLIKEYNMLITDAPRQKDVDGVGFDKYGITAIISDTRNKTLQKRIESAPPCPYEDGSAEWVNWYRETIYGPLFGIKITPENGCFIMLMRIPDDQREQRVEEMIEELKNPTPWEGLANLEKDVQGPLPEGGVRLIDPNQLK